MLSDRGFLYRPFSGKCRLMDSLKTSFFHSYNKNEGKREIMARYAQLYSESRVNALLDAMGITEEPPKKDRPYYRVGVGIGAITTKAVVMEKNTIVHKFIFETGLDSNDSAKRLLARLEHDGFPLRDCAIAATGIGQLAFPGAQEFVEIGQAHGRGAHFIYNSDGVVIDIGGQETQVMTVNHGTVKKIATNDRCSAAIGKYLQSTASRMGITEKQLSDLARKGTPTALPSMCIVFVESKLSELIAKGAPREDVCWIAIEAVVNRVAPLIPVMPNTTYMITGGQCNNDYLVERLSKRLGVEVLSSPLGIYAGVIGAALSLPAKRQKETE